MTQAPSPSPSPRRRASTCEDCTVRERSACACLSHAEIGQLQGLSHPLSFAVRESLFVEGQRADAIYSLTSGMARLYKLLRDGRRQIVGFALPGEVLGFASTETFAFSADAVTPVVACAFPRSTYLAFVDTRPHLLRRLHEDTARELALAQEQMLLLGRRTAEERLVCFLLGMRERWARVGRDSPTVALPMGRQDIADFLGLTIETVSRGLNRLAREGAILLVPDGVRLLDGERMARLAAA